jgi:hypothetical protein
MILLYDIRFHARKLSFKRRSKRTYFIGHGMLNMVKDSKDCDDIAALGRVNYRGILSLYFSIDFEFLKSKVKARMFPGLLEGKLPLQLFRSVLQRRFALQWLRYLNTPIVIYF